jgi:hypothetical protein
VRASQRRPAHTARSIITPHAIRTVGDRGAGLRTADLGERPFDPLALPLPLLIGRRCRCWTRERVEDVQPRQRQQITERIGQPPEWRCPPSVRHRRSACQIARANARRSLEERSRPTSAPVSFRCARPPLSATDPRPRHSSESGLRPRARVSLMMPGAWHGACAFARRRLVCYQLDINAAFLGQYQRRAAE